MKSETTIIQGDALELFKNIEDESVDLIITDPPYNLGKDYGNNKDSKQFNNYLDFSEKWLREARRVLKPTGSIYVFMGFKFISYIYNILEQKLFQRSKCWKFEKGIRISLIILT